LHALTRKSKLSEVQNDSGLTCSRDVEVYGLVNESQGEVPQLQLVSESLLEPNLTSTASTRWRFLSKELVAAHKSSKILKLIS
jgi:hypothetical protein